MNENPTIAEPVDAATAPLDGTTTPPPPPPGDQGPGPHGPGQEVPPQGPHQQEPYQQANYQQPSYQQYYGTGPARPPLRRSRHDRVLGGVCGGIAEQYGIDPVLLRILLVVAAVFTGGLFLLFYLLAWAFIPDTPLWAAPTGTSYSGPDSPSGAYATSYAGGGTGTYVDPATGTVHGPGTAPIARRRAPRSYLGLIAISLAIVVGGVLTVLALSGVSVPAAAIGAAMLAVLGLGLLVGAFRGRARWLIAPAVLLLLATQLMTVIPRAVTATWGAGTGTRVWVPTSLGASAYDLGAGDATLDLAQLPSGSATITARVGLGTLTVLVPDGTKAVIHARVGAGSILVSGQPDQSGTSQTIDTTFGPYGGAGADPRTTVDLTTDIGLGELEVRRA